jgi:hypothetical protein
MFCQLIEDTDRSNEVLINVRKGEEGSNLLAVCYKPVNRISKLLN